MKRSRYSETQIINILKEAESGIPVEELCRKHGFSQSAFYKWKAKYSGMDVSSLARLRALEEENQRLKKMYADLSLEHLGLKEIIQKKTLKPDARKDLATYAMKEYGLSERQACKLLNLSRSVYRYQAKKENDEEIARRLLELAARKPRWGFGKMADYLKNAVHGWNHKRISRPLIQPEQMNQSWSMDFMSDSLTSGKAFRTFNILDDFNREALWIEVDTSLPAERVIRVLEMIISWRGCPKQIRLDNGPEFSSHRLENWAKQHNIQLIHIQPGKPAQNAYIERFNRTFREDILNAYLFNSLKEVRDISEQWLEEYNAARPHEALHGLSPYQYSILNT